jgi:transcriptional regulatory protein RtcR
MKKVVLGLLGTTIDNGNGPGRWERWRPSVSICQHDDFQIDRFELLSGLQHQGLAKVIAQDIEKVSPETKVRHTTLEIKDPWDFAQVYEALSEFAARYPFKPDQEEYFIHITTGTHVAQICLFLLAETRAIPAKLLQASPPRRQHKPGEISFIDLDLSQYDRLAARFAARAMTGQSLLKAGIDTRNDRFNTLIEEIENVATRTKDPLLLTGATGTGKSELCKRIYELKKARHQLSGDLVAVNCATLRGDGAMSALFGHVRGAYTGASDARTGFLKKAHGGLLFLDEVGELGLDEQAMLLKALEEKTFYPVGSDKEVSSQFQLVTGTNRDLLAAVKAGQFRDDLLARISLWTFRLPSLCERTEDIEPNLDFELRRIGVDRNAHVSMSKPAREHFLAFATSPEGVWHRNFRDFGASVRRMATLCTGGRISERDVFAELARLRASWADLAAEVPDTFAEVPDTLVKPGLDRFDRVQLADVIAVCRESPSLSAAGRALFAESRKGKASSNDSDRLRKYLARFDLSFEQVKQARTQSHLRRDRP